MIALGSHNVYWVEIFGVDWSYTGNLAWQALLTASSVVAAVHIVCPRTWHNEEATDPG